MSRPENNNSHDVKPTASLDKALDQTLRPQKWDEYIGQELIKKNLRILIQAASERKESIEHLLFYGPAGLGKTPLAFLIAKGPSARSIQLELPPFTLIAATTRVAMLSSPLRSRFSGGTFRLEFYTNEEVKKIINRSASLLGMEITDDASEEIAKRCRFTPRIANHFLKRCRDYAQVNGEKKITLDFAKKALALMEVDAVGLNNHDRRILNTIIDKFK